MTVLHCRGALDGSTCFACHQHCHLLLAAILLPMSCSWVLVLSSSVGSAMFRFEMVHCNKMRIVSGMCLPTCCVSQPWEDAANRLAVYSSRVCSDLRCQTKHCLGSVS